LSIAVNEDVVMEFRRVLRVGHDTVERTVNGFWDFAVDDTVVDFGLEATGTFGAAVEWRVGEWKSHDSRDGKKGYT